MAPVEVHSISQKLHTNIIEISSSLPRNFVRLSRRIIPLRFLETLLFNEENLWGTPLKYLEGLCLLEIFYEGLDLSEVS